MLEKKLQNDIKKLFEKTNTKNQFIPGRTKISLIEPTFNHEEIIEALDSMITTKVTMGKKVKLFEKLFSKFCQSKHGIMVNSGSSANLLGISCLVNPESKNKLKPGSEVITPAVTWPTTIYPLINAGLKPKFVDVNLDTYCIDDQQISDAINDRTSLLLPVHLLGNVCNMDHISDLAKRKKLPIMEDCCEAHGAKFRNKPVGTFGLLGTFSFFLSHHITTIEGGMLITNDSHIEELARTMRAFGWIRDIKNKTKFRKYSKIDKRFLFVNLGFNIRPTEIQGAFGLNQVKKLEHFIELRKKNTLYWNRKLEQYSDYFILPKEQKNTKQVHFCYPLTIKPSSPFTRKSLVNNLEKNKIETRSIMSGNITEQPVMKLVKYKQHGTLPNSKLIMRNSFLVGNHQGIHKKEREFLVDCFIDFIEHKKWKS